MGTIMVTIMDTATAMETVMVMIMATTTKTKNTAKKRKLEKLTDMQMMPRANLKQKSKQRKARTSMLQQHTCTFWVISC